MNELKFLSEEDILIQQNLETIKSRLKSKIQIDNTNYAELQTAIQRCIDAKLLPNTLGAQAAYKMMQTNNTAGTDAYSASNQMLLIKIPGSLLEEKKLSELPAGERMDIALFCHEVLHNLHHFIDPASYKSRGGEGNSASMGRTISHKGMKSIPNQEELLTITGELLNKEEISYLLKKHCNPEDYNEFKICETLHLEHRIDYNNSVGWIIDNSESLTEVLENLPKSYKTLGYPLKTSLEKVTQKLEQFADGNAEIREKLNKEALKVLCRSVGTRDLYIDDFTNSKEMELVVTKTYLATKLKTIVEKFPNLTDALNKITQDTELNNMDPSIKLTVILEGSRTLTEALKIMEQSGLLSEANQKLNEFSNDDSKFRNALDREVLEILRITPMKEKELTLNMINLAIPEAQKVLLKRQELEQLERQKNESQAHPDSYSSVDYNKK